MSLPHRVSISGWRLCGGGLNGSPPRSSYPVQTVADKVSSSDSFRAGDPQKVNEMTRGTWLLGVVAAGLLAGCVQAAPYPASGFGGPGPGMVENTQFFFDDPPPPPLYGPPPRVYYGAPPAYYPPPPPPPVYYGGPPRRAYGPPPPPYGRPPGGGYGPRPGLCRRPAPRLRPPARLWSAAPGQRPAARLLEGRGSELEPGPRLLKPSAAGSVTHATGSFR